MSWAVSCNPVTQNPIVGSNRSAITFSGTLAPGALLVLFCEWLGTGAIDPGLTVTDSVAGQPNTYTIVHQDVETVGGSTGSAIAYCRNPTGIINGTTLGFNFSTNVTSAIVVHVYPGKGSSIFDKYSGQITPDSTGTFSSGSITTAQDQALCVGFASVHGLGGDVTPGAPVGGTSGWNTRIGLGANITAVSEDFGQDSKGAIAATFTSAAHDHATAYVLSFILVDPAKGVVDNFNRANGALGANWTNSPSLTGLQISGNQVVSSPTSTFLAAYWNANPFANDQSAQVDVFGANGNSAGAVVRHQVGSSSFYAYLLNLSGDGFYIRYDSGTINILLTETGAGTGHVSPTSVALRAVGSTLIASIAGADRPSVTDTHYTSGYPGILCYNNPADNFVASPFVSTTGTLVATEAADTFAASGTVAWPVITGVLAATEAADTFAASGNIIPAITGTLAATEAPDTFTASGSVSAADIIGVLGATEAPDTLQANGSVEGSKITDVQSYAFVIRDVFFDCLTKREPFFANHFARKTKMVPVQPNQVPYLGVYIVDEIMIPDGDANAGDIRFSHTVRIGFSVMYAINDQDKAEAAIDAAFWKIMNRIWCDQYIMNLLDTYNPHDGSQNPDDTRIEGLTRGTRRHVFGTNLLNNQTPLAELQYEVSVFFRTGWGPTITDDLLEIDVTTHIKDGAPDIHSKYVFDPATKRRTNGNGRS
jgi:hypothetical protein